MKDLLSLSFELKKQAVHSKWNLEDALTRFKPLLSAIAVSEGVSEGSMVGLLLAKYLQTVNASSKPSREIAEIVVKCMPEAESDDACVATKSGKLDKVSDDCLKLALRYLDFGDRCNAVERTCHRLFTLSRAVPIHCDRFDKVWNARMQMKAVRRFHIKVLDFRRNYDLWNSPLVLAITEHFRATVSCLGLGYYEEGGDDTVEFERIYEMEFPNLRRVEVECTQSLERLLSNPNVRELVFDADGGELNTEDLDTLAKCISDCKRLRKVAVLGVDTERELQWKPRGVDFSHVVDLKVEDGDLRTISRALIHDKVQCLDLSEIYYDSDEEDEEDDGFFLGSKPTALQRLVLDRHFFTDFSHVCIFEPCQLQSLEINAWFQDIWRVYQQFSPAHLKFVVDTIEVKTLDECLHRLTPKLATDGPKTLCLCFAKESRTFKVEDVYPLFQWLAQVIALLKVRIEVQINEDLWAEVKEYLKDYALKTLEASISLTF